MGNSKGTFDLRNDAGKHVGKSEKYTDADGIRNFGAVGLREKMISYSFSIKRNGMEDMERMPKLVKFLL